ncbi:MAG: hypothetical protein ACJ72X_16405 [Nitrososphaeraceae archaeon]
MFYRKTNNIFYLKAKFKSRTWRNNNSHSWELFVCVRLLLEINDVSLNWKKITRVLPRVILRYALDRIPTVEEIREIVDAAYIR